ncbi:uncharacterized protein F4822DRAFT_326584 [Hypoxylon trugodes]|uniref:uncharacterized protein n=1 Tax=Hypoxylon trugodes TaxID=326681 RepID=UPI00219BE0E9|nr:uncharacterized protein F4822DRAFT_326584 [Hypoxylon trugodes]KAI1386798.1 hypothetical protein F4822DRAFT_326584 [Hypoxylon trugodes]
MASAGQDLTHNITTKEASEHGTEGSKKCFAFLNLPAEIRMMIYPLLLCSSKPLSYSDQGNFHLTPAILRTCRQILNEARPLLYEENVFEVIISTDYGVVSCEYVDVYSVQTFRSSPFGSSRFGGMTKFSIVLKSTGWSGLDTTAGDLTCICRDLRLLPELRYLHVKVSIPNGIESERCPAWKALGSLALLRRVGSVVFDGVPPDDVKYLTDKMTGLTPVDDLPQMYEALKSYMDPIQSYASYLNDAYQAMIFGDVDTFKYYRRESIYEIKRLMDDLLEGRRSLYEYDTDPVNACDEDDCVFEDTFAFHTSKNGSKIAPDKDST